MAAVSEDTKKYILDKDMAGIFNEMAAAALAEKPADLPAFLIEWLKKNKGGVGASEMFRAKMAKEGLSQAFITAFLQCYCDLVEGKTGMIPEDSISPVTDLPSLDTLPSDTDSAFLAKTVVLKLNGGLGTSMGLEKAKSLLKVKEDNTFLDFIAKQILHLRKEHSAPLKFMLMNSFSTTDDTKSYLSKYPELLADPELELLQHKAPKVRVDNLEPVTWDKAPEQEWCPPGHGDLYAAFVGSGKMDALLKQGFKYVFISNSDNLGATLDMKILTWFAKSGAPMMMEVCERTESDKKGGHLAKDTAGNLLLRESAQCAKSDEPAFQDITKHKYFNTNNLWLNLPMLKDAIDKNGGLIPLPMIRNSKTVDPRDANSTPVYQLETAMGAAIASLPGSTALVVPRSRFAPVKTCADLFVLRSDAYVVTPDWRLELAPSRNGVGPVVDLDTKLYKLVDKMESLIPNGVPSLVGCDRLVVKGPVAFSSGAVLQGAVSITNGGSDRKEVGSAKDQTLDL